MCNSGCEVHLTATDLTVTYIDNVILSGSKEPDALLWTVQFPAPQESTPVLAPVFPIPAPFGDINSVIRSQSDADYVRLIHATLGSPPISSFLRALDRGYLDTIPRLNARMVRRNEPHSPATAYGFLDQTRQGQRSTRPTSSPPSPPVSPPPTPDEDELLDQDTLACLVIKLIPSADLLHVDATGRFPHTSRRGTSSILLFIWDNYVHIEPLCDRSAASYVKAYKSAFAFFRSRRGHLPPLVRLDNETSRALEDFLSSESVAHQFVPPGSHRANRAEPAIRRTKNHIIATLCTTHPTMPLDLWDLCLPQSELTLNWLRPYGPDPTISAYAGFHGHTYDFTSHPIAPFGTFVVVHDKPASRGSWAPHGSPAYYIGPALQHYRSWEAFMIRTADIRVSDTIAWFPAPLVLPGASYADSLDGAIRDFTNALDSFQARACTSLPVNQATRLSTIIADLHSLYQPTLPAAPPGVPVPNPANSGALLAHPTPVLPTHPTPGPTPATPQRVAPPPYLTSTTAGASQRVPLHPRRSARLTIAATAVAPPDSASTPPGHPTRSLNLDENGAPLRYNTAVKGPDRLDWITADADEFRRLFVTRTWHAIYHHQQPLERRGDTTYYNRKPKEKLRDDGTIDRRIRGTLGGDKVHYPFDAAARTAELELVKVLLQSTMADDADWFTIDLKDFYLNSDLPRPEYVRIPIAQIQQCIIDEYHLFPFVRNGAVLFQVDKSMYGLPQAGKISRDDLVAHLRIHGYVEAPCVPGLFTHANGVSFTLVVDDFGIKAKNKTGALHLISTLEARYPGKVKVNWKGDKYLGMTIAFNADRTSVTLSMDGYIEKALQRFSHLIDRNGPATLSPFVYTPPTYGMRETPQLASPTERELTAAEILTCQQVIGVLLYYARAIDSTMLTALNAVDSELATPTLAEYKQVKRILGYAATYPDNRLVYNKSNMTLILHSDASYHSRSKGRSVVGGIGYLGSTNNGPTFTTSKTLDVVVSSAAEAEYGGLFVNCKTAVNVRNMLVALSHEQPATPVTSDSNVAVGLANDTLKIKRSKAIDLRFHWIRDRIRQGQFDVTWAPGRVNLADFFTKALPVHIHQARMHQLVQVPPKRLRSHNRQPPLLRKVSRVTPHFEKNAKKIPPPQTLCDDAPRPRSPPETVSGWFSGHKRIGSDHPSSHINHVAIT